LPEARVKTTGQREKKPWSTAKRGEKAAKKTIRRKAERKQIGKSDKDLEPVLPKKTS